jgi:hypothetical protein
MPHLVININVPLQEPGDQPWDVQLTDAGDRLIYASQSLASAKKYLSTT